MDTKLKKSRPFAAWLAFFIANHLLAASILGGMVSFAAFQRELLTSDYKDTANFKQAINYNFSLIFNSLNSKENYYWGNENILYLGNQRASQGNANPKLITNSNFKGFTETVDYVISNPSEFSYLLTWDGSKLSIIDDGISTAPSRDAIYSGIISQYQDQQAANLKNCNILIAVRSNLTEKRGMIYSSYLEWRLWKVAVPADIAAFILGFALLIISEFKRKSRKEFSRKLGWLSGKFWLEWKILITIIILFIVEGVPPVGLYLLFWWFMLMILDLSVNGSRFFTHNSISWVARLYRGYESRKPFQKAMINRFIILTIAEGALIFFTLVSVLAHNPIFVLLFIAIGVFLFYRYLKSYSALVTDIGKIVDQAEVVRSGNLNSKLRLPETSVMYGTAENLNHIQEGVQNAMEEQLRSERMKLELITNVSHDLRTPLTSMVNYIDLLSRENLVPEHANDYVKVLSKKASRLTALTQDIFDISKAQSGNLELNIERIDIVELVKQSLAELEERISESKLDFRVNLPQEKVYINADGRKLYRVFDNLISNILKYSLVNTRVYIDLLEDDNTVSLHFKNIAAHELNINPADLMERFVRGDEARSSDGSGLGLAIVQSFIALCGGEFEIQIDGDLFKAVVRFKKA